MKRGAYDHLKRFLDIAVSGTALVILSPVILLVALFVRLFLGRPILFTQVRPGRNAAPFEVHKFRSMTDQRGADGALLPDEIRLTRFGRFLRTSSLDELPQLWNVFKGEMSLVGPRPLLMQYLPLYTAEQNRRHEVRPGITGWAQVNGRNNVEWAERLKMDVWYVDNRSLAVDLAVVWKSILVVARRTGISREGNATMPHFTGDGSRSEADGDSPATALTARPPADREPSASSSNS